MLQSGNYKVQSITDCFIGESSEKKTPFFCLNFKLENGETIPWQVYLSAEFKSDAHRKMAIQNMETLAKLGFKGNHISDLAEGSVSDLFDQIEDEIFVVIEMESYETKDGQQKERPRVKFVNVGAGGFTKMDKKQAAVVLKSMSYDAFLTTAKTGIKPNVKKSPDLSSEDVPF